MDMEDCPLVSSQLIEFLRKRFSTVNLINQTGNYADRSEALGVIQGMSNIIEYLETIYKLQQGDLDG